MLIQSVSALWITEGEKCERTSAQEMKRQNSIHFKVVKDIISAHQLRLYILQCFFVYVFCFILLLFRLHSLVPGYLFNICLYSGIQTAKPNEYVMRYNL